MNKITEYNENGKPVAGRYSWEENGSPEFTDAQLQRLDELEEAARVFLRSVSEIGDLLVGASETWPLIEQAADILTDLGYRVRIPTHVVNPDGSEYVTDWHEKDI